MTFPHSRLLLCERLCLSPVDFDNIYKPLAVRCAHLCTVPSAWTPTRAPWRRLDTQAPSCGPPSWPLDKVTSAERTGWRQLIH